jgi:hypothetical protein
VSAKFNGGDLIGARELSESFRDGTHPHSLAVDGYLRLRHAEQGEALFGPA